MTLTADEIIREAELSVQLSQEVQIEKKASEAADDMINQRSMKEIEKIAEDSPLIKLAMESEEDFMQTKSFKVNFCLEKVAAPTGAVAGFLQKMMANNGARNIMVGAGVGAGSGLIFGPKDDKFGAVLKGGLLGGLGGAGVSAYKSLGNAGGLLGTSGVKGIAPVVSRTRSVPATETNALLSKVNTRLGQSGERAERMVGNRYSVIGDRLNNSRNALQAGLKPEAMQSVQGVREDILKHVNTHGSGDLGSLVHKRDIEKTLKGSILNRMGFQTKAGKLARTEEAFAKMQNGPIHENYSAGIHKKYVGKVKRVGEGAVSKFNEAETKALADKFKDPANMFDRGILPERPALGMKAQPTPATTSSHTATATSATTPAHQATHQVTFAPSMPKPAPPAPPSPVKRISTPTSSVIPPGATQPAGSAPPVLGMDRPDMSLGAYGKKKSTTPVSYGNPIKTFRDLLAQ